MRKFAIIGLLVPVLVLAITGISTRSVGLARIQPAASPHFSARVIPDTLTTTWVNLVPSGTPPDARAQASAIYDPTSDDMTIFGGCVSGHCLNDVWVLTNADGHAPATWVQLNPAGGPPSPRGEQSSVYDPGTNRMIMFGGNPNEGGCLGAANDVWVLTGANGFGTPAWTQLNPTGTLPGPRNAHSAVYDVATNRMIVFGGIDACGQNGYYKDVWVLSNANGVGATPTWTKLAVTGTPPAPRAGHSAVYDPNTNRMIVFGGGNNNNAFGDVWVLSDANGLAVDGSPHWTQLSPTGSPGARAGHSAVYDAETDKMFIFGGPSPGGNDVWVLSHASGLGGLAAWLQLTPAGGPPAPRVNHTAAFYNPARHRMTIFSGSDGATLLNDVWVLTGVH
jgi:galactose oxidase-like protein